MWVASRARPMVPLLTAPRLISLIPFGFEDTFYFVQKREYSLVDKSMLIIFILYASSITILCFFFFKRHALVGIKGS